MAQAWQELAVYLETGKRRVFAGAVNWPGWARSGRDEAAALQALFDYGPRYEQALQGSGLAFQAPAERSAFAVVERLAGNSTTDFGAPAAIPTAHGDPLDGAALQRLQTVLQACWQALDEAAEAAAGRELAKGPRGGGRELEGIVQHVLEADKAYLSKLGWKAQPDAAEQAGQLAEVRRAILEGLAAAAAGEIAAQGPRGGARWPARYFVHRVAWHTLDHAWEIEDRMV